ncbi:NUDIX domain-containing protein [Streptomyces sp. NPDC050636]|uniref:NUDIX domain-containing protein n=1 Tax=Streptomyces sp. NPDC050636 TaxID=3154510 RepID=UPI00342CBC25
MTTRLVAAVLVTDPVSNRLLVLRRSDHLDFAPGEWDVPSGKGEPQEPVTATAARELKEETGLLVDEESLRLVHVIHGSWGDEAPGMYMALVFHTDQWRGQPRNAEPEKHDVVEWASPDNLPQPFSRTTLVAVQRHLSGGSILSFDGWPAPA